MSDFPSQKTFPQKTYSLEHVVIFASIGSICIAIWCFLFTLGYMGLYQEFPLDNYFFINYSSLTSAVIPAILTVIAAFSYIHFSEDFTQKGISEVIIHIIAFPLLIEYFFILPIQVNNTLKAIEEATGEIRAEDIKDLLIIPIICFLPLCSAYIVAFLLRKKDKKSGNNCKIIRNITMLLAVFFLPIYDGMLYTQKKLHSSFSSCIHLKQSPPVKAIILYTNSTGVMAKNKETNQFTFYYASEISKVIYDCETNIKMAPSTKNNP